MKLNYSKETEYFLIFSKITDESLSKCRRVLMNVDELRQM